MKSWLFALILSLISSGAYAEGFVSNLCHQELSDPQKFRWIDYYGEGLQRIIPYAIAAELTTPNQLQLYVNQGRNQKHIYHLNGPFIEVIGYGPFPTQTVLNCARDRDLCLGVIEQDLHRLHLATARMAVIDTRKRVSCVKQILTYLASRL